MTMASLSETGILTLRYRKDIQSCITLKKEHLNQEAFPFSAHFVELNRKKESVFQFPDQAKTKKLNGL